mmetsp:Transcript_28370/g.85537  ORF Transcript_28370/g.85537 Transcript_28370/m.85537 type:complete len:200 (+) Transcript_28370:364-963(+)
MDAENLPLRGLLVVLDGVRPQQVPQPLVVVLLQVAVLQGPPDPPQRVGRPVAVADPAVHDQDLVLDDARQREESEAHGDGLVESLAVSVAEGDHASPVEAVLRVHVRVLVVAAVQKHVRRVHDLQREQQAQHLDLVLASIDEVPVEDRGRALRGAGYPEGGEEQQEVPQLAVDVTKDFARGLHVLQCLLARMQFSHRLH